MDFQASSGTFGVDALVLTKQANDASGILGAWATIDNGTSLAANNGSGAIVAYTGYTNINALGPNTVPNNPNANVRVMDGGTYPPMPANPGASPGSPTLSLWRRRSPAGSSPSTSQTTRPCQRAICLPRLIRFHSSWLLTSTGLKSAKPAPR